MCLFLGESDKKEFKTLKEDIRFYRKAVRQLDKTATLYHHNKIMYGNIAKRLNVEYRLLKRKNRKIRNIKIKALFKLRK